MRFISRINHKVLNTRVSKQISIDLAESRQSKGNYPIEFKASTARAVIFNNLP